MGTKAVTAVPLLPEAAVVHLQHEQTQEFVMKIDLSGKRAVVTGSTSGIGLATAKGLAEAGAHVVVNGRTAERVNQAVARIQADLPDAGLTGVAADLSTAEGVTRLTEAAGEIDILINNLGTVLFKPFAELTDEDWRHVLDVNLLSGVRLTRHYLPRLISRGWGRIVFVSSESALVVPKQMIDYSVSKVAQLALSRGAAELAAGTGVTVNAVVPGPTKSEGLLGFLHAATKGSGATPEQVQQGFIAENRPTSLIQRFAQTEEVANMIVYLSSPQASATTGAALRVDGGVLTQIV